MKNDPKIAAALTPSTEQAADPALPCGRLAQALEELTRRRDDLDEVPMTHGLAFPSKTEEQCPPPDEWLELVWNESPTTKLNDESRLLAHAAACHRCAALLKRTIHLFSDEVTPEESAAIAGLASATPERQHQLALAMANRASVPAKGPARTWIWAGAAFAAVAIMGIAVTWEYRQMHEPERLLAQAYSANRSFAMRIPGAAFAALSPRTQLRGEGGAPEPLPLAEARAQIERKLAGAPQDARWLQLQAREDLLQKHYDQAIGLLDPLLAKGNPTASLLTDDAIAYDQRGLTSGNDQDRATALDLLRKADELAPGDPVVLFNEALAMEAGGESMNAVETWNRYLRFERDPKWIAEGRGRLQALQARLNRVETR